jgi:acetoin utilization deacetylase AcuC-like enzyme
MAKYGALRRRLEAAVGLPLGFAASGPVPQAALERVHDGAYVEAFLSSTLAPKAVRRIGFPSSDALVARTLASAEGTRRAAWDALAVGVGANLAGGTHHASRSEGSGYCIFNDIAVAAAELLAEGAAHRVLVLDLDVHQGDGTARIFEGDDRVFTCSVHGAKNFPFRKARSDLDVPLADDTGDAAYLGVLEDLLPAVLDRARPDVVFYQAGVDALADDRLGRLALGVDGIEARDRAVFAWARRHGLPLVLTLGGGYADPIDRSLDAHVRTYRSLVDELLV